MAMCVWRMARYHTPGASNIALLTATYNDTTGSLYMPLMASAARALVL